MRQNWRKMDNLRMVGNLWMFGNLWMVGNLRMEDMEVSMMECWRRKVYY